MLLKKERNSNLELFRIITMYLIVLHHYVVNSGLTEPSGVIFSDPLSWRSLSLLLFGAWGKTGTNCFVIITGYFMCKSHITLEKFLRLFCEVMFYRIIIYFAFLLFGYESFSILSFAKVLIPVTSVNKDFAGCYLLFYLTIPFINKLIQNINEKQHIYLIALCSFIYILLGTVHKTTFNYVTWFIVIYFIGSYIRMYPKKIYSNTRFWGIVTAFGIVLLSISIPLCAWIELKTGKGYAYAFASDSNSLLPVLIGTSSFIYFNNLSIKKNKIINSIAASTFGVFCIHANSNTMRKWLWKDTLDNVGQYSSPWILFHAIISVMLIFIVCVIIDKIRILAIERPFFYWLNGKYDTIKDWYTNKENLLFQRIYDADDRNNKNISNI